MSSRFEQQWARVRPLLRHAWSRLQQPTGVSYCARLDYTGVTLTSHKQGRRHVSLRVEGDTMDALAQVLQQVAPSRWAQAAPLTVVFGYPFARDYTLPWPEGITRLRDYQAYAMHHAPFAEAIPGGWQVGFHLPRWGAAAQSYAVPAVQCQTVLALCKETRMRLFAVHTPLSASLAQYRARLPRDCALVVLEGVSLHCAFVRDAVVTQTFCWPWNAVRPLRDSLTLACALAGITLPDTVWIAAARPDDSAVWDEWVWLGEDAQ